MTHTPRPGELLVAIMNEPRDFAIARQHNWYRLPVASARKWLKNRWPPEWLAFYHTKVFGPEAYSIRHYARVIDTPQVRRRELFPGEPEGDKSDRLYYQVRFTPLQTLPLPILSRRRRRIVFIPTTWQKFIAAAEINDLYDDSPLEDHLWTAFKRRNIPAERQEFVTAGQKDYILDFAVYCAKGSLDVETDGDTWHANPEKAAEDNRRDNRLEAAGWSVLRFSTREIREEAETYCVETVAKKINKLGGIDDGFVPRRAESEPDRPFQRGLFDDW